MSEASRQAEQRILTTISKHVREYGSWIKRLEDDGRKVLALMQTDSSEVDARMLAKIDSDGSNILASLYTFSKQLESSAKFHRELRDFLLARTAGKQKD